MFGLLLLVSCATPLVDSSTKVIVDADGGWLEYCPSGRCWKAELPAGPIRFVGAEEEVPTMTGNPTAPGWVPGGEKVILDWPTVVATWDAGAKKVSIYDRDGKRTGSVTPPVECQATEADDAQPLGDRVAVEWIATKGKGCVELVDRSGREIGRVGLRSPTDPLDDVDDWDTEQLDGSLWVVKMNGRMAVEDVTNGKVAPIAAPASRPIRTLGGDVYLIAGNGDVIPLDGRGRPGKKIAAPRCPVTP